MTRTIATLLATATIAAIASPAAAQTKYYARERIVGMPDSASTPTPTNPPASTPTATCAMKKDYTITGSVNFGPVGNTKGYASLQQATSACESINAKLCYINYYTGSPYQTEASSGTPYAAYSAAGGSVTYYGTLSGRTIYSGQCVTK